MKAKSPVLDLTEHSEGAYAFGIGEFADRFTPATPEEYPVYNNALREHASILAEAAEKMAAAADQIPMHDRKA